jgi:type IV pilus assembly protein PilM
MALGIDLGSFDSKMVELVESNDLVQLKAMGTRPLFPDISTYSTEKLNKAVWSNNIQELCKKEKISIKRQKQVAFSIPSSKSIFKHLVTLEMDKEELVGTLELEAKKQLSGSKSDIIIDYHIMGQSKTEIDKINVLLAATTRNEVQRINSISKHIGFKNVLFNSDPIALMNCFLANYDLSEEGVDVIIHSGSSYTGILVVGRDQHIFFREIDKGNDAFIREVMSSKKINYSEASLLVLENGVNCSENNQNEPSLEKSEIEMTDRNIINDLCDDIRKTLRYYLKNNGNTYFKRFFISGGMAHLKGYKEQIEDSLKISTENLNPFNKLETNNLPENFMQYTIATGLAIRGLIK